MQTLKLKDIAKLANGMLNDESYGDIKISNISIDTRTLTPGELYIPITGEVFNGHKFIESAKELGAKAAFLSDSEYYIDDFPLVIVENTNDALAEFSKNYKNIFNPKIVALTGSNGKTTTKDLIFSVLEEKYNTIKTIGNLNNHIGLPLTMLRFDDTTEAAVLEMGTDGFGQIELLSNTAQPDIAIITNIGDAHLEQLGSKENIAIEKFHIIDGLKEDGYFIYNNDDITLRKIFRTLPLPKNSIGFGFKDDSDIVIEILESNENGSRYLLNKKEYYTPLVGKHQIYNTAVAIIVGNLLDIENDKIVKSLLKKEITHMRSELLKLDGFDILDDSYKSNPQAVESAIDTLNTMTSYDKKVVVLGDMLELGQEEVSLHENVSKLLNPKELDYVLLYGPLSKYTFDKAKDNFEEDRIFHFDDKDLLISKTKELISENTILLVKASRSMHLEDLVNSLK